MSFNNENYRGQGQVLYLSSSMSEFAAYITHRENILTNLDRLLGLVSPLPKETADVTTVLSPPEETEYVVSKELMSFIDSFKVI